MGKYRAEDGGFGCRSRGRIGCDFRLESVLKTKSTDASLWNFLSKHSQHRFRIQNDNAHLEHLRAIDALDLFRSVEFTFFRTHAAAGWLGVRKLPSSLTSSKRTLIRLETPDSSIVTP